MTVISNQLELCVGRRVSCILYGGDDGIIYAVHGTPNPASVKSLGGGSAIVTGGNCYCDVVWSRGTKSAKVPEAIIYGVQWGVYDEIATTAQIGEALAFADSEQRRRDQERIARDIRRLSERQQHCLEHPELLQHKDKPEWSNGRLAGENIRRQLKRYWPDIKFSVKTDHNTVDVNWTDGPVTSAVDKIAKRYQCGSFDGMTDCYNYDRDNTFADVFGGPEYVFCARKETVNGVRAAWVKAGGKADDVPDTWVTAGRWQMVDQSLAERIQRAWCDTDLSED